MAALNLVLESIYNQLLTDKKVNSQRDFAEKLEFHEVAVSGMVNGKKALGMRLLQNLHDKFGININYIFSGGQGNIYLTEAEQYNKVRLQADQELNALKQENEMLKTRIADKEKIIALYDMYIKGAIEIEKAGDNTKKI